MALLNIANRSFGAFYRNLAGIADYTLAHARAFGFDGKALYAIELALDEACANIIDHAYEGEGLGSIDLQIFSDESEFIIELEDTGKAFNPEAVPEPDLISPLEMRSERGLGVYTIRKLMDRVEFSHEGNKNRLIMGKRRPI
ncbi:MAG: ATP-binding protein [Anaerolineaceae bacterium]|nr:ATP-binding protein [Anaerolineaceae bacterium]